MNTRYRLQLRRRRTSVRTIGVTAILVLLLVAAFGIAPPRFLRSSLHAIAAPVWSARKNAGDSSRGFFGFLKDKQDLISENKYLEDELRKARLLLLDRNAIKNENIELKKLLGRFDEKSVVLTSILSRPNATPYDTLIVDTGFQAGVEVGDLVLGSESTLLGAISEVFKGTAVVKLYSSPGVKTSVMFPQSELAVTAEGIGGGVFSVRLPKDILLSKGDLVTSVGIDHQIVGIVGSVSSHQADSFQTVLFRSPVNLSQESWLLIDRSK